MKKTGICLLLALMTFNVFAQQLTRADYLKKSKNQKTGAWVLLAGGIGLVGIGAAIGGGEEASFDAAGTGIVVAGIGVLASLASIPLFIASAKNKRRAAKATASFNMQQNPLARIGGSVYRPMPGLAIRLSF